EDGNLGADRLADGVEVVLGRQEDAAVQRVETLRAHADLLAGLLAGDIENLARAGALRGGVHEKRRLADTRLAPDEDEAAADDAAAQHAIQLPPRQTRGPRVPRRDLGARQRARVLQWSGLRGVLRLADLELLKRVPGSAVRAL